MQIRVKHDHKHRSEVYIILTVLILSWIDFILPLISANISSSAADMASKAAKICKHGAQCNQHGEADTPWEKHFFSKELKNGPVTK